MLGNFGDEKVTRSSHLEKLALIRGGVGKDSISDFATNLIKHFLLDYTQTFALQHVDPSMCANFNVARAAFSYRTESWVTLEYILPKLDGDYVLLTPLDLLTKDDTWINRTDMVHSFDRLPPAVEDAEQRALINNYLQERLGTEPTEKERFEARARTLGAFPELVDLYIKLKEDEGEQAAASSLAKTKDTEHMLVDQVKAAAADIAEKTDLYSRPWTSYDEALNAVATFKTYVEDQDGYKLINRGGGQPFAKETEVQSFFGLLLQRTRFDVNREPNNGRGPVDYKISEGAHDKSLIEFKLAKSSSLKRNLENQVAIYEKANGTRNSVKVIISCYTESDQTKVTKVLKELGLSTDPSVVVIDARSDNKSSASTA